MYTLIMMAALTTGAADTSPVTFFHNGGGCRGCHGCSGCYGCYGCSGCNGCWGSYSCGGCYGGCYGCSGCMGSCYGGCYGGGYSSCYGCWGTCYGCHGCYGCYGCYGCTGGVNYAPVKPEPVPPPKKDDEKKNETTARLIIEVPSDAKLFVDDYATKTNGSSVRTFTTPALERDQNYYYILRCETVRDGKTIAETKKVIVRAGGEVRAAFKGTATEVNNTETAGNGR